MSIIYIIILELLSIIIIFFSFKLHKNLLSQTYSSHTNDTHNYFSNNSLTSHQGNKIYSAGVCVLGKLGAWVLLIMIVTTLLLSVVYYTNKVKNKHLLSLLKCISKINVVFIIIMGFLEIVMNFPLFLRSLPALLLQILISIHILHSSECCCL